MTDGRERADFYVTLGVGPLASYEEIRSAYRQLARRHHPDATASRASAEMLRINEAWRVLSDRGRRESYDRTRAGPRHAGEPGGANATPSERFVPIDDSDDDLAWVIPEVDTVIGRRWMLLITFTVLIAVLLIVVLFVYAFARSGAVVR